MVSIWLTPGNFGRHSKAWEQFGDHLVFEKRSVRSIRMSLGGEEKKPAPGKGPAMNGSGFDSENLGKRLLAVLLNARGAQTRQSVLVNGELPGQKLIHGQRIAAASFLKRKQATANRGNNFGFTADDPPLGSGSREIRNR
jgi:hypothetical protein